MLLFTFNMVKMYIVVIICLNTRQNHHLFSFPALQHSEVWEILILALPNINRLVQVSIFGKFPRMLHKLLKVLKILFSSLMCMATHLSVLQFYYFWLIGI